MNDAVWRMDILFAMPYPESAGMVQIWVTSLVPKRPKLFISPGIEIDTACRIFKSCRLSLFGQPLLNAFHCLPTSFEASRSDNWQRHSWSQPQQQCGHFLIQMWDCFVRATAVQIKNMPEFQRQRTGSKLLTVGRATCRSLPQHNANHLRTQDTPS